MGWCLCTASYFFEGKRVILGIFSDFFWTLREAGSNVRKFMFCVFLNGIIMSAIQVMLGIHYKNIGMTEDVIGTLMALKTFGSAIGALFAVVIIQTFGTKRSLIGAFLVMAASGFCYVNMTDNMLLMQATSLIFGIAQVVFTVSQAPFYKNNSDERTAVTIFSVSFVLGNVAMFTGLSLRLHVRLFCGYRRRAFRKPHNSEHRLFPDAAGAAGHFQNRLRHRSSY